MTDDTTVDPEDTTPESPKSDPVPENDPEIEGDSSNEEKE